jgi:hypothetical protein
MSHDGEFATARARSEDVEMNCPFCGHDAEEWQATMLHEAHEQMELLALADPGSDEFKRHLAEIARFVGVV